NQVPEPMARPDVPGLTGTTVRVKSPPLTSVAPPGNHAFSRRHRQVRMGNVNEDKSGSESHRIVHRPVLLDEVTAWLRPVEGAILVDGTVGAGGHAAALAKAVGT